ncbi:MAG: elongation factor G [Candidatus Omnitrophota bacterium]|nr:MAG: elongation factor G [Candidatus Omnitrophota bacterium]RKY34912.1 MAG: elongation factor G [Candidatus Omnitrophota bacterium]RKY44801.1 MAG: elongation factor G [Candidatus Omnitrophota bacterium]
MKEDLSKKKVFVISGHAQSGKTSLTEALLYKTGVTSRLGKVEEGNTLSDYSEDEIERKSSINASFFNLTHKGFFFQFIDTPGYLDFIGELISASFGVDFGIIVVDATSGVEVGTEKAWQILRERNLPCLFFINKLDKENTDYLTTLKDIKDSLAKKASPLIYPLGEGANFKDVINILDKEKVDSLEGSQKEKALSLYSQIVENIAESDDTLLEKYLEKGSLEYKEIIPAFKKAIISGEVFPVLGGSATSLIGIDLLIEVLTELMPSCSEFPPYKGKDEQGNSLEIERKLEAPFSAQVIKTIFDPYVGQLNIFRVFSGKLTSNSGFYNSTKKSKEKITQLYFLQGKEQRTQEVIFAGEIGAVAKLKDTSTGDSLCGEERKVIFPEIKFPEPTYSASVKPKTRQDEEKISGALTKLSLEDPTFKVGRDPQTKELIVSGVGELHINVIVNRIKRRFSTDVELGKPKVPYKETITKSVKVQGKYKKQTGGRGQYGDVWIEVEPLERGKEFEFVDKIVGGAIPRNFIPSVEKGIRKAMQEGFLAGYPITDIRVTLYDGSYHPVDSSDIAFQIAGSMALKKALEQGGAVLLEPIMNVEIVVPEEFMGQVTGDINSRRGRVLGMEAKGKNQVVKVQVPLAEMFKYASDLRSVTGGRGSYSMSFSHYEIVPQRIAQGIIEQAKKTEEEE